MTSDANRKYSYWPRDTSPEIAAQFHRLMKMRSDEERFLMGCSMYGTARQIVESSIRSERPGITPEELKREVFLRFYGQELAEAVKAKILARI